MNTTKAAIYLRVSSDPTGQHLGVDRQREDCLRLAAAKGWAPVEYLDNDVSATNGKKRPGYQRMLADIADDRLGAIVVWDLDRLYRQPRELEDLIDLADGKRLDLATVTGDCDLSTDNGRLFARIKGAVGKSEAERKAARQRRAALQKAEKGKPQWRSAFGYLPYSGSKEDDTGVRELDPVTAPLVARAYVMILNGCSLGDIAAMFNDAEAFGLKGQPWTHSTVSLFLRKPRNAGLREYHGDIVGSGTWPALVDESTWRAVQSVINQEVRKPGPKSVRQHLLTGLMRCGKPGCDGRLSGQWVMRAAGNASGRPKAGETKPPKNLEHRITYGCKKCRGVSIRAEQVEPVVLGIVIERLSRPDAVDLLKAPQHDEQKAEQLRLQRRTLVTRRGEIADERADGLIDGPGYRRIVERIDREIEAIDAQQADAERVRIFDGLPLGTPEVAAKVQALTHDRYRAVVGVLFDLTIQPVGKGHRPSNGKRFDPNRLTAAWK